MFNKIAIIFCTVILLITQTILAQTIIEDGEDNSISELEGCENSMVNEFGELRAVNNKDHVQQMSQIWCRRKMNHNSLNKRKVWDGTYDYIVVGAGSAGSVVSARLAEVPNNKVLLIEAGGPQPVKSDIPALLTQLTGGELDWNYKTIPQKNFYKAYVGNQHNISRGKAFGGCSMHNDMNYYRENPEFFKHWTEYAGVKGWTWNDVLPYFKRSENNLDDNLVANSPNHHVKGGQLSITTAIPDPILKHYMDVSPSLGYPNTYPDGRQPYGSTIMQRNIFNGVRESASLIFLEQNRKSNLHILGESFVTKIIFNKKKRAIGVQFYRKGKYSLIKANKEIIISAGAVNSAKLLMLSGVGPKQHLKQMKFPIVSDLGAVGKFVYSPLVAMNFNIKDQSLIEKPIENYDNYHKYFIEKRGPLTYKASGVTCFKDIPDRDHPSLSNGAVLVRTALLDSDLEKVVKVYKLKDEWREYYRPYLNRTVLKMIPILKRPQGHGTIRLSSTNPFDPPIIDPCTFCKKEDFEDFVETFKKTMEFFMSPAMSSVVEPFKNPIPGCKPCADEHFCKSYLQCITRTITGGVYPNGGCPMGGSNDGKSVVDARMRVFGVSGLRVIDSSVMPILTEQSATLTVMIADYGSDMIKEDNP